MRARPEGDERVAGPSAAQAQAGGPRGREALGEPGGRSYRGEHRVGAVDRWTVTGLDLDADRRRVERTQHTEAPDRQVVDLAGLVDGQPSLHTHPRAMCAAPTQYE